MLKIITTIFTFILYLSAQAQEWKNGTLKLNSDELIEGKFDIQHFGHLTAVRHLSEDGTQNTFNIGQIDWMKFIGEDQEIIYYETFNFLPPNAIIEPKILLRVLYSSDSIQLLRGDVRSIQRYFTVYPLPGIAVVLTWGKGLVDEETILLALGNLQNLTVISKQRGEEAYGFRVKTDNRLVLRELMKEYENEIKEFVKKNKLSWNDMKDLCRIVEYYDQLKYLTP